MSSPLLHSSTVQRIGPQFVREMNGDMVVFQTVAHIGLRMILAGAVLLLFPNALAMAQVSSEDPLPTPQSRPSLEGYSLPPGPGQASDQNVLQGPVDEEIPLARPPVVTPRAAPARAPAQSVDPIAGPADSGSGQPPPPVRQAPLRAGATEAIAPPDPEPTTENPSAVTEEQSATPDVTIEETDANQTTGEARPEPASRNVSNESNESNDWLLLLVAALFFVLLGGMYMWRTYRTSSRISTATKVERLETSQTDPVPKLPEPQQHVPVIAIGFQPHKANATLFNAVVGFELTLSNQGDEVLTGIKVHGAMVQAAEHSSGRPVADDLPPLHVIPSLLAGKTETVRTELRVPLTSIDPIIFRSQALFVPLVQISIEFTDGAGFEYFQTAAYLVGQEHQPQRPKLAPLRLDLGPRSFAPLGHRRFAEG
ncbi:hypothetical protein [Parasphingorhabdus sp.]|uniref:hypothetical protein n=1 Tax=Parasphingorhabdus sp. TaxID=2709688 RepID=UPI0030029996